MKNPLLSELKKTLVAAQVTPIVVKPKIVPSKNPDDDLDDASLFAKATKGVQRLVIEETVSVKTNLRAKWDENTIARRAAAEGAADMVHEALSDTMALLNPVNNEAILSFRRTGIQQGVFKKLKDGQLMWKAAVDLHGCTVEQARQAVLDIIFEAQNEGITIIKIVHGKGFRKDDDTQAGLLKTCVNGWLQQHRSVLAFHSALPKDGGNGAVMVLLKKQQAAKNTEEKR